MDRNLWIRIQATGAATAGQAVQRVGREMRTMAREVQTASAMVRTSTQVMADKLSRSLGAIPARMRTIGRGIAAEARAMSASFTSLLQSAGAIGKYQGPGKFATTLSSQLNFLKTNASVVIGSVTSRFTGMTRTVATATRDWSTQIRAFGQTMNIALGVNTRAVMQMMWQSVDRHLTKVQQKLVKTGTFVRDLWNGGKAGGTFADGKLFELGRDHEQAAHAIGLAFGAMGASILGAFGLAIREAATFQQEMQNVLSVFAGESGLDRMRERFTGEIFKLSSFLPQSPQQLAVGLYEVAQAGFRGTAALQVLRAGATAASAGLTDTVTAVTGLQSVINAYGAETSEAAYISDVLFMTVRSGIISFEQLAQQIGDFVGFAAAAGIRIEDLGIAMATMTRAGIPAAEAATSLNRVIQAFVKPSVAMKNVMDDIGISVEDFRSGEERLYTATEKLRKATGGNVIALQKLFPEIRAARGAYALMADEGRLVNEVVDEFGSKANIQGQTMRALKVQSESFNYQSKIMRNELSQTAIEIGNQVLPTLTELVKTIADVIRWWQELPTPVKVTIEVFLALVGIVGSLTGAMFLLLPRIADTARALEVLGITSDVTSAKIGKFTKRAGIIGAVLLTAAAAIAIFKANNEDAAKANEEFGRTIAETGAILGDAAREVLSKDISSDNKLSKAFSDTGLNAGEAISAIQGVSGAASEFRDSVKAAFLQYSRDVTVINDPKTWELLRKGLRGSTKDMDQFLRITRYQAAAAADVNKSGVWDDEREGLRQLARVLEYVHAQRQEGLRSLRIYRQTQEDTNKTLDSTKAKFLGASSSAEELVNQQGKLSESQSQLNKLWQSLTNPADAYKKAEEALRPLNTLTSVYSDTLKKNQEAINEQAKTLNEKHNDALTAASQAAAQSARERKRGIDAVTSAVKGSIGESNSLTKAISANAKRQKYAVEDAARATIQANSRMRTKVADYQREAQVTTDQYIRSLQGATREQGNYYRNIDTLAERGFGDLTDAIADGSDESAALLSMLAQATDTQLKKIRGSYEKLGPSAETSFNEFLRQLRKQQRAAERVNENMFRLIAKGNGDLVRMIVESSLDPQQQAQLINQATKATDEGLRELYTVLSTANYQGTENFAVTADRNIEIITTMIDQMNTSGEAFTLDSLWEQFKKVSANTELTKDDFILAMGAMGDAIDELPENVRAQVTAYVDGADDVLYLNQQIAAFEENIKNLPSKVKQIARGTIGSDLERELNMSLDASAKVTSMTAGTVNIYTNRTPTGRPAAPNEENGGVRSYALGGMTLPRSAIIQSARRGLVQWAEPSTGGEAFIPLASSKRRRSMAILNEVADRFGYALVRAAENGGVNEYDSVMSHAVGAIRVASSRGTRIHSVPMSRRESPQVSETRQYFETTNVGQVVAHDYDDFKRQMEHERNFHSSPGNLGV